MTTTLQSLLRPGLAAKAGLLVATAALTVHAGASKADPPLAPTDPITKFASELVGGGPIAIGDKIWSGFSFGGGFIPSAEDTVQFTVFPNFTQYQIQYNLDPNRLSPISGIFNYTITIDPAFVADGFLLESAEANVTGSASGLNNLPKFQTSVSSAALTASPLNAGSTASGFPNPSTTIAFLPNTTTASFSQAFSATSGATGNQALLTNFGLVVTQNKAFVPSVPGPLPILGAAAAFGFSRKLRRRIGQVS